MFYSTEIFKMADFSVSTAQTSTIGMGIVNVLTTVVSVWLIEASGRKPLLLIGFGGMVIALTLLFISLYYVVRELYYILLLVFKITILRFSSIFRVHKTSRDPWQQPLLPPRSLLDLKCV